MCLVSLLLLFVVVFVLFVRFRWCCFVIFVAVFDLFAFFVCLLSVV